MELLVAGMGWLFDPLIFIPALLVGALAGDYRVSVPCAAIVACGLVAVTSSATSALPIALALCFGGLHGAVGLLVWNRVPDRFKQAMTSE